VYQAGPFSPVGDVLDGARVATARLREVHEPLVDPALRGPLVPFQLTGDPAHPFLVEALARVGQQRERGQHGIPQGRPEVWSASSVSRRETEMPDFR